MRRPDGRLGSFGGPEALGSAPHGVRRRLWLTPPFPVDMLRPVRTLAELQLGGSGVIADVTGGDAMAIRLLEMGLVPGTSVKLLKMAPMGDPMQLQVRGYHLSLRKAEAARVQLRGSAG